MLQAPLKFSPGIMLAIGPTQQFMKFDYLNGLRRVSDKAVRDGIRELPQRRSRTGLPPNSDMMAAVVTDRAQDHVDVVPAPGKTAAQGITAVPAPGRGAFRRARYFCLELNAGQQAEAGQLFNHVLRHRSAERRQPRFPCQIVKGQDNDTGPIRPPGTRRAA